jgi:predicted nucleic acid-binding protein
VYSYSNSETDKQNIARKLITENNSFISTQVLQELANTITRKFNFAYEDASNAINECCQNNSLHTNTSNTILRAFTIAQRYNYSFLLDYCCCNRMQYYHTLL